MEDRKFFTFQMTIANGVAAIATFERADWKAAISAHHATIASSMADDNLSEVLCMAFDNYGNMVEPLFHWEAVENRKFFTFQMTIANGVAAIATFERADLKTAISANHSTIASSMADDNLSEILCMVFDNYGNMVEPLFHWEAENESIE